MSNFPTNNTGITFEQAKVKAMKAPKTSATISPTASTGIPQIPNTRPTSMRNLTPWKGWTPGKSGK